MQRFLVGHWCPTRKLVLRGNEQRCVFDIGCWINAEVSMCLGLLRLVTKGANAKRCK